MPLPTSPLSYPTQDTIDTWNVREGGARDQSSPTDTYEMNNSTSRRKYYVKWAKRYDFIAYMLGYSILWNDSGTTRISRLLPRKDPDATALIATKVTQLKGFQWKSNLITTTTLGSAGFATDPSRNFGHTGYQWSDGQASTYTDADIEILFEHPDYFMVEDSTVYAADPYGELGRYVAPGDYDGSSEYLTLPGGMMKYAVSGGTPSPPHNQVIPFNNGKVLSQEKFQLIWKRLPYDIWSSTSDLFVFVYGDGGSNVPAVGRINKTTFYGRPAGTVLFESVKPILMRDPRGDFFEWQLTYNFTFNPYGWNNLYYYVKGGTNAGFYYATSEESGGAAVYRAPGSVPDNQALYNETELNKLFKAKP